MTNLFDLTGKVAVVTGGNGGIGLGMAKGLGGAGANVAIWGTNEAKTQQAAAELSALGIDVMAKQCDVSNPDAIATSMAAVVDRFGQVDSCFVNAGVPGRSPSFLDCTPDEWRRVLAVNLDGAFFTAQAAVRQMIAQGTGGSIVFTTSGSAKQGQPRTPQYAASKAGLDAMMRSLAIAHARDNIRANGVLAGWTQTDMTEPALNWDKFRAAVMPRIPARRWGTPDDFAAIAVYLASDASSYHTGDVIALDGGYHIF
jgi:NAD(P)-dependent dehydrogenase (short-subunit alcohol dehydrogenase family)